MLRILVHNWWLLVLRGIFALAFALFVFLAQTVGTSWLMRAVALASVVEFFGLFAICAGIVTVVAAVRGYGRDREWRLLLADGIGAIAAGLIALMVPAITFVSLVWLIGIWAFVVGVCELLMARKLRRHLPDERFLALASVGSLGFAALLFVDHGVEVHILFVWLGAYSLFSAVAMLALGFRLRNLRGLAHKEAAHVAP